MGVFASLAALAFGFGLAFAAHGPWMILPFAGVEIVAVGTAFLFCGRSAGDVERVRVSPDALSVERVENGRRTVLQFNPRWARLKVLRGPLSVRVLLEQSGRSVELGANLGQERRAEFAAALRTTMRAAASA